LSKTKGHSQSNTPANTLGTFPWTAPEYLTVKRYKERNEKGDVFSFGVIVWELITRQIPWKSEGFSSEDIKEAVVSGDRLEIPSTCPEDLKKVMNQCWKDSKRF
jgi:serine/threonine protein kinase